MPATHAPNPDMAPTLLRRLAGRLAVRPGAEDRARAALHALDWAGCAAAGAVSPAGARLAQGAAATGAGACVGVGMGAAGLSPAAAALVNGGLGNVLEMDDVHRTSILHPGPVAIPAALAAAQATGAGAAAFLDALVIGYEAMIRVGASVGPGHYQRWHNTSTCGPFGAAAAAGALLGLSEDAMVWALGNAGSQAAGPWRCRHEPVMTKQLHTARAAMSGLQAAELAALGFTGPEAMLEGAQGFYDAFCPDPDPAAVIARLDGPWMIWDVSFKPWPACRHAHPAIDAALDLRARGAAPAAIRAIRIETYAEAVTFCDRPAPTTTHEAKFSLQHAVAACLADGPPPLAAFEPDAIARPDLTRLRGLTAVAATPAFTAAFPRRYGAAVEIDLATGETLRAEAPDALGDPENPVDEARLIAKARALCAAGGRSPDQAERLIAAALALPDDPGPAPLAAFASALAEAPAYTPEDMHT
ncbi:2-methylcitrate dehydratase PrpD [Albimonas donghaensis]|uniref:2-methylcitrate dehydratase PrpD n=1 Tax=Albimonas donghaensis TaxID=356660 RepID=A0A1H3BNI2_9RHOB|nr:MmgE/PrpD family protein [Albimonas donghaensis]SDX43355.1 2-methylcitrate dehydratase PrpD [Albimonas donghaensis]